MTALTIRDVPADILRAVKVHAAQTGQSLQAYVLGLLERDAVRSDVPVAIGETIGERIVRRASGSANNPETAAMTTDELMELLRGD